MNNFALLYSKDELDLIHADERLKLNVNGRFNPLNFYANERRFQSCESFLEQMKAGRRLWDIPWVRKLYEQDNDESEEEDEDEEEEEEI